MACTSPPTADAVLDLEADAGLGLNNNDPVSVWLDQSTSANNALQGTATNQPTFKSLDGPGGTRPCVTFDGTNDFLTLSTDLAAFQRYTIFAVIKPTDTTLNAILSGAAGAVEYRHNNSGKQDLTKAGSVSGGQSTTSLSLVNFQQINVRWDGTSGLFRLSQAADGMFSAPFSSTARITAVGYNPQDGAQFFVGSICMIKVFAGVLALDQVQAEEAAILTRWGV